MNDDDWYEVIPGVYDDHHGVLHIVPAVFLAGHGYRDTAENRRRLLSVIATMFPELTIEEEED